MATTLTTLARSYLTPEVIQKASNLVGESFSSTEKALHTAVPTIVTGVADSASTPAGAQSVMAVLDEAGLTGARGPLSERLRGMSGEELSQLGEQLLGRIFGPRLGPMVETTAATSGVKTPAMSSLLGLAGTIVLGVLGHNIHASHLDAAGLTSFLANQKTLVTGGLPAGAPSIAPVAASHQVARDIRPLGLYGAFNRFWPLGLIGLLVIGAILVNRRPAPITARGRGFGAGVQPTTPSIVQRAPPEVWPAAPPEAQPMAGTELVDEVQKFLDSGTGEPTRRFAFEDLNFDFSTTNLTPQSLVTLESLARVLASHPDAKVVVEGHTDNIGVPAANERLSLHRANAVRNALIARGIDADRVTAKGLGQSQPIASNNTTEGRAKNRRTELVVTR